MGQRGHGGTSGYKTRVHMYPGTGTSGTTGNTRVQSGGTHVPLRHILATGTLPFLGVSRQWAGHDKKRRGLGRRGQEGGHRAPPITFCEQQCKKQELAYKLLLGNMSTRVLYLGTHVPFVNGG